MNPTQKRNHRVDKIKDDWAAMHGYVLLRIWEHDIRNNPGEVMDFLRKRLYLQEEKIIKKNNKKKRH